MNKRYLWTWARAGTLIATALPTLASAQAVSFDLGHQPMATALTAVAREAGVNILFAPEAVRDLRAPALRGRYTSQEAVDRLLSGTRLEAVTNADRTIVVRTPRQRAARDAAAVAEPMQFAQVQSGAAAASDATSVPPAVEEIVVTARRFRDLSSASSSKLDVALVETPQSITIVPKEVFDSIGLLEVVDVAQYIPGVNSGGTFGLQPNVTSRGFNISEAFGYKLDGLSIGDDISIDPVVIERVEFIKGANSISYGINSPGGFFNIITKPTPDRLTGSAAALIGSFDQVRVEGDIGAPLDTDGRVSARVAGSWQRSDDFYDFGRERSHALYGALTAKPVDSLSLFIKALYQDASDRPASGIGAVIDPAVSDRPFLPNLSDDFFSGLPWSRNSIKTKFVQAGADYTVAPSWTLGVYGSFAQNNIRFENAEIYGGFGENDYIGPDGETFLYGFLANQRSRSRLVETRLNGDFELFGRTQKLLVTADWRKREFRTADLFEEIGTFNIFNPDYFAVANPFEGRAAPEVGRRTSVSGTGIATNLFLELTDRLKALVGGRYDDATSRIVTDVRSSFKADRFSPRAAAIYSVTRNANLYYSYSESFEASIGFTCSGATVPPEISRQHEAGAKAELGGGRLLVTANLFHIKLRNALVDDPDPACVDASIPAGRFRSKGAELEIIGNVTPQWNVIGGYAYTDADYIGTGDPALDDASIIDQGSPNTPRHKFSIFTTYDFATGPLAGVGIGGGVALIGRRPADAAGALDLPSAQVFDAALYYKGLPGVELSLNVKNLTDERVYQSRFGDSYGYIMREPPRSVLLRATARF